MVRAVARGAALQLLVLVAVAGFVVRGDKSLSELDACVAGGSAGLCRRLSECPAAVRALTQDKVQPQRCGFRALEPVVCCVQEEKRLEAPTPAPAPAADDDHGELGSRIYYGGLPSLGDRCQLKGMNGTCVPFALCPWTEVDRSGRRRNYPRPSCAYDGEGRVVVCCPDKPPQQTEVARGEAAQNLGKPPKGRRRSETECISYETQRNKIDQYILGGRDAFEDEFPHMAALGYNVYNEEELSWACAGSLISDEFVLTAAHCCNTSIRLKIKYVQLGNRNLTSEKESNSYYGIKEIFIPDNYTPGFSQSDICLLKLDRKVQFSTSIFPACLNTYDGFIHKFEVTGWGATDLFGLHRSKVLQKTTISSFGPASCREFYKDKFRKWSDSAIVCAGDPLGIADTCKGDSGGPLFIGQTTPYTIVGITAIGPKPCGGTQPALYTRVFEYLDWIENRVWPSQTTS